MFKLKIKTTRKKEKSLVCLLLQREGKMDRFYHIGICGVNNRDGKTIYKVNRCFGNYGVNEPNSKAHEEFSTLDEAFEYFTDRVVRKTKRGYKRYYPEIDNVSHTFSLQIPKANQNQQPAWRPINTGSILR